jgi:thiol-disulfide isomerase/thioredoxin
MKRHKLINWSNFTTVVIGFLMVVILVSPTAKATIIKGLMKIGLFQPPAANTITAAEMNNTASVDLLLKSSGGKTFNLKDLKGKVLIVNFWATWCPPCIAEMSSIDILYKQFKNNSQVLILPVDVDNDLEKATAFMTKNNYSLPVYNAISKMPENMVGEAIPTTVIINKTGKIVLKHEGAADYTNLKFINYLNQLSKN